MTKPDDLFLALQEALAGRYSIDREIGRGGMGVVFRATQVRLGRPVALKLIRLELADDPEYRARFQEEARLAPFIARACVGLGHLRVGVLTGCPRRTK